MNRRQRLLHILTPGWQALRLFWLPFCIIQVLAVALVLSYYHFPSAAKVLGHVADWKANGGIFFSALSTGLAGALVPELFKWLTGTAGTFSRERLGSLCYSFFYFSTSGAVIDLFYRGQAFLFGPGSDFSTVFSKVLLDQFVFTPFWSHPYAITWFLLRRMNYNVPLTLSAWGWPLYRDQAFPMLLPGWAFWLPMTGCIYSLPSDLQIPLFLFAISAWSLLFMFIASDRHTAQPKPS